MQTLSSDGALFHSLMASLMHDLYDKLECPTSISLPGVIALVQNEPNSYKVRHREFQVNIYCANDYLNNVNPLTMK